MIKLIHIIYKSLYLYFIGIFLIEALPLPRKGFKAGEIREINFINKIKKKNENIDGKSTSQRFLAYKINPFLNVLENDLSKYEPNLDNLKIAFNDSGKGDKSPTNLIFIPS